MNAATCHGRESDSIVSTLLEMLVTMLQLNFAYVRLSDSFNGSPVEFVQLAQLRTPPPQALEIARALDRWLTNQSVDAALVVPNPAGEGEVRIAPFRLGIMDEIGVLVANSKRANFQKSKRQHFHTRLHLSQRTVGILSSACYK